MPELLIHQLMDKIHILKTELATIIQSQESTNELLTLLAEDANDIKADLHSLRLQSVTDR
ncbi:hypothetical protein BEP19_09990 [Ammoniphilus oxalaticus]|uniref:Uncharacterized protein n=1 Tax=Ammoniphilus oxalaticus TaxID=66863 RepID=A0A419SFM1_9BACL|nr:hypothetical protein [Ammoniphilus oxalaticus]RKD22582.1 hypothetical protein BEP19_09990 [Ammoniphilus oxalaticus]